MEIKNLHYVDCLLLHGWHISIITREHWDKFNWAWVKNGLEQPPFQPVMYVSPRNAYYHTHSVIHVPQDAIDDAHEHGDFE